MPRPSSRSLRGRVLAVALISVLALSGELLLAKPTGFFWTQANRNTGDPLTHMVFDYLNDPDVTNGSIIFLEYGWDTPHFSDIGTKAVNKQLRVIMEMPWGPGMGANYWAAVAEFRANIPANLYSRLEAVAISEELYGRWKGGALCGWAEFADLCDPVTHMPIVVPGDPNFTYIVAGIDRINWFLSNVAHPALAYYFPGKQITIIEGFFNNNINHPAGRQFYAPVPAGTTFLTMDTYAVRPLTFDQGVVPYVDYALTTIPQPILLVGNAFYYSDTDPVFPSPGFAWPRGNGIPAQINAHNYCNAEPNTFIYNMCRFAYWAATEPKIKGMVWFGYGHPKGMRDLTPYNMTDVRNHAVLYNSLINSVP